MLFYFLKINIPVSEYSQPLRTVKFGFFGTKSEPDVHILEPQDHNLRSFFLMYMLDPLYNIVRHHPLTECRIARYLHICIFCIRVFFLFFLSILLILGF